MDYFEPIKKSLLEAIQSNEKDIQDARKAIDECNKTIQSREVCIKALKENLDKYEQMQKQQYSRN